MSTTTHRQLADENSSAGAAEQDGGQAAIGFRLVAGRECSHSKSEFLSLI